MTSERVGGDLPLDFTQPSWAARRKLFLKDRDSLNYANFIDAFCGLWGKRTAFVLENPIDYPGFSGSLISFDDVARMVSRMAHGLREAGVRRGDRVGLITMNRIEIAFANFAAARIGAIPVPMNFMLRPAEINHILERSGAATLVFDRTVFDANIGSASEIPAAKRLVMVGPEEPPSGALTMRALMENAPDHVTPVEPASREDTAILFYTSGTTGFPKGAMISHEATLMGVMHHGRVVALRPTVPDQLAVLVMPVAHAGGYAQLLHGLGYGIASYFLGRFDPRSILEVIERYRATVMSGTPAMFRILLENGARTADLTSIRIWGGGADAFTRDLVTTMRDLATRRGPLGIKRKPMFIRGYGMAEANSFLAATPPWPLADNALGRIYKPIAYRIVDEEGHDVPKGQPGELWIRGANVTRGYWNDPKATAAAITPDGWFRTGDIVKQGRFKMLSFVDRAGDIIKTGGYKVAAAEIEQTLTQHPDVEHAAAVGMHDEMKGQRPMAAVKLRGGATVTDAEILSWAQERLAAYKCPRRIFVMDDMPFTFSLKPKRTDVRERIAALLAREQPS
jgi:acyl-CoA synthetase (AMP-forming)/AMP-acid ligase II